MRPFIHAHNIRQALIALLTVSLTLTPPPFGLAAGDSIQGREDEEQDSGRSTRRNSLRDCLPIGTEDDDQDGGRQNDDRRDNDDKDEKARGHHRNRSDCLPGGSSSGVARGDFNGDSFADLAVGVTGEDTPRGVVDSGAVNVIYGSANGLTTDPSVPAPRFFSQNAVGVPFASGESRGSEDFDGFGTALAAGDFNGDTFSDLAIGVPGEEILAEGIAATGRVVVIYGSPNGLVSNGGLVPAQSFDLSDFRPFTQNVDPSGGGAFGKALTWGDFNGDQFGDLAIGAPLLLLSQLFPSLAEPPQPLGAVFILFGSEMGLFAPPEGLRESFNFWHATMQAFPLPGVPQAFDRFGEALAAGDFNGDRVTDLAIGVPFKDRAPGVAEDSGAVLVLFAVQTLDGEFRLNIFGPEPFVDQCNISAACAPGLPPSGGRFGTALAVGDFDHDGRDDLAMSAPFADIGGSRDAGEVWVMHGPFEELRSGQNWRQDSVFPGRSRFDELSGVGSPNETSDLFGSALAAGDFNGDGTDDLAIGAPGEDLAVPTPGNPFINIGNAGAVTVIYSSPRGLSITERAPQLWHQGLIGAGDAEADDQFGTSLTAWNFGRNHCPPPPPPPSIPVCFPPIRSADLAVGVPLENLPVSGRSVEDCGQVNVLYGSPRGLTTENVQRWHQGSHENLGGRETGDRFGATVY